jgi:hypothetical protein
MAVISTGSEPEGLSMGRLSTAARKRLPASDFALPGKRAYPIPDINHARNAEARVAQHGTAAEKAEVREKVAHAFPSIGHAHKDPGDHRAF